MKLKNRKYKALQLGRNKLWHLSLLGTTQLESSLAEKDMGVAVDTKLNMTEQNVFATTKPQHVALTNYCLKFDRSDLSPQPW